MVNLLKTKKQTLAFALIACIFALCVCLTAFGAISPHVGENITADATDYIEPGEHDVTVKDLMERHGVKYAIGPKLTQKEIDEGKNIIRGEDNVQRTYNNIFGIPSDLYFNAENYLYIDGTTLVGFKDGLKILHNGNGSVEKPDTNQKIITYFETLGNDKAFGNGNPGTISGDGYYKSDENATPIGPYINVDEKYVIIVPDNVTKVGKSNNAANSGTYVDFAFFDYSVFEGDTTGILQRERVGGFFFTDSSSLTEIEGGILQDKKYYNRTNYNGGGEASFAAISSCNNMRFCRLPNVSTFKTIGAGAFWNCGQLRDINIPQYVTSIGDNAFEGCSSLRYLDTGSATCGKNVKKIDQGAYVIGGTDNDNGSKGFYFAANGAEWQMVGLAGPEDTRRKTVYKLPEGGTLTNTSERRTHIKYDYLQPNGKGYKKSINETIENYSIKENACNSTWIGNLVIPNGVTSIGANAFYFSHIQYLEIAATVTNIGANAFARNSKVSDLNEGTQYYYIHGEISTIDDTAFGDRDYNGVHGHRTYIFDNKDVYDKYIESDGKPNDKGAVFANANTGKDAATTSYTYQIPISAVVETTESDVNISNSEMDTLFRADSEYNKAATENGYGGKTKETLENGANKYTITYTKKLNGKTWDVCKQFDGSWSSNGDNKAKEPNITGNLRTEWYKDPTAPKENPDNYTTSVSAATAYQNRGGADSVSVYGKSFASPEIEPLPDRMYDKNISTPAAEAVGYKNANPDDFGAQITGYTTANNYTYFPNQIPELNNQAKDAGTYTIRPYLNEKWGEWGNEKATNKETTYTITRAKVDIAGKITKESSDKTLYEEDMLIWQLDGGKLLTDAPNLYFYPGEGWYPTQKKGATATEQEEGILNSVADYDATAYIMPQLSENEFFNVTTRPSRTQHDSGRYYDNYTITLKDTNNYEFENSNTAADEANFGKCGITVNSLTPTTVVVNKRWFIVMQSNWLTFGDDAGKEWNAPAYVIAKKDGVALDGWTYGDTGIEFFIPDYAFNTGADGSAIDNSGFTFTLSGKNYGDIVNSTSPKNVKSDFAKYVNSSMPTDEYYISITAPSVGTYPTITQNYKLVVSARDLPSETVSGIQTALNKADGFEREYNGSIFVHDEDLSDWLNADLQGTRKAAGETEATNAWMSKEYDSRYEKLKITYNHDRMNSSEYLEINDGKMPFAVGEYNVYYKLEADNYNTVGGKESERNNYAFKTVIYRAVPKPQLEKTAIEYTGSQITPTVKYDSDSQYYKYSFAESTRVDSGDYNVTLTLNDKLLSRWKIGGVSTAEDQNLAYKIIPTDNVWEFDPSITGWAYDGYDAEINAISYRLQYNNASVSFEITGANLTTPIKFTQATDVAEQLKYLAPDKYTLKVSAAPTERVGDTDVYNVKATDKSVTFTVTRAANSWKNTPFISGWSWNGFPENNVLSGEARYPSIAKHVNLDSGFGANKYVYIAILKDNGDTKELAPGFSVFTLNDYANQKAKFKTLERGEYYILAAVKDSANYYGINTAAFDKDGNLTNFNADVDFIRFEVTQTNNSWLTSPRMVGWDYKTFDASANFVPGVPQYSVNNTATITYELYDGVKTSTSTPKAQFFAEGTKSGDNWTWEYYYVENETRKEYNFAGVVDWNASNNYTLYATMAAANNFGALTATVPFRIAKANITWTAKLHIDPYTYGDTLHAVTEAVASNGATPLYTVKKGDSTITVGDKLLSAVPFSDFTAALGSLGAGEYTVTVSLASAPNYNDVTAHEAKITVNRKANRFTASPSVNGKTYDGYAVSNPALGTTEDNSAVKNATYYKAEANGTLIGDALASAPINAGYYALVVVAEQTVNYLSTRSDPVYFRITQAQNGWNTAPETSITGKGQSFADKKDISEAKFGNETKHYYISGARYDKLADALQSLYASNDVYTVEIRIEGNDNYTALNAQIHVTVQFNESAWDDNDVPLYVEIDWDSAAANMNNTKIKLPTKSGKTVTYTVMYNDTVSTAKEVTSVDAVFGHLQSFDGKYNAGTYKVIASYDGGANEQKLRTTVTIEVKKVNLEWVSDTTPESNTNKLYGDEKMIAAYAAVKIPGNTNNTPATYKLIGNSNNTEIVYTGDLNEFLSKQPAGFYTLDITVDGDTNYNGISATTTLVISKAPNSWKSNPPAAQISATRTLSNANVTALPIPEHGVLKIMVGNESVNATLEAFTGKLNALPAGSYTVRYYVEGTDNYAGIDSYATFTMSKKANSWKDSTPAGEIKLTFGDKKTAIKLMPEFGSLSITIAGGTFDNSLDKFNAALTNGSLDAGTYTITASATVNNADYTEISRVITVNVAKKDNEWETSMSISASWDYGTRPAFTLPEAQVRGATVTVTVVGGGNEYTREIVYNDTNNTESLLSLFETLNSGTYTVTATLPVSLNYNAPKSTQSASVTVNAAPNGWDSMPHVIDSSYKVGDTPRFDSEPQHGRRADVVYKYYYNGKEVTGPFEYAGEYTFTATLESSNNYASLSYDDGTFEVGMADNIFAVEPGIAGWGQANWVAAINSPTARAAHGTVSVTIQKVGSLNGGLSPDTDSKGTTLCTGTIDANGNFTIYGTEPALAIFDRASVGWYRFTAVTANIENQYKSQEKSVYFQVYQGSEARPANRFLSSSMESWTVYDENIPAEPEFAAIRSTNHEFIYYGAKLEGGKYVADTAKKLSAKPSTPGKYVVRIESWYIENGVRVAGDDLSVDVPFEILTRENTWTVDPAIENWELGGKSSTPKGAAKYSLDEHGNPMSVTFKFKLKSEADDLATETLPTKEGDYEMIASINAAYCTPLEARVDFTVSLSKNKWIDLPTVENWSAENPPMLPKGLAQEGEITYSYMTKDRRLLSSAPTEEGEYILVATVEKEGYETLTAEYEFTITAAYDTTLLTTDIILGVAVCLVTILVIIFAVRRYRQC